MLGAPIFIYDWECIKMYNTNSGIVTFLVLLFIWLPNGLEAWNPDLRGIEYQVAKDIEIGGDKELLYFYRPVSLKHDDNNIFVLDDRDCVIKVFSKIGILRAVIGRPGDGPGELSSPSDMDIYQGKIYVADKAKVQIYDKEGKDLGNFKLPLFIYKILILDEDKIIVSVIPLPHQNHEKLIYCFDNKGNLLWKCLDAFYSGDSVYDVFRNQIFLMNKSSEGFFVVKKAEDRNIYYFDREGKIKNKISLSNEYSLKQIEIPLKGGKKELNVLCWDSDSTRGLFYLLVPEYFNHKDIGLDLGPGQKVAVISGEGKLIRIIKLPDRLTKISVDNDFIYGIDTSYSLRIMRIYDGAGKK